jgi:hypothetical protein
MQEQPHPEPEPAETMTSPIVVVTSPTEAVEPDAPTRHQAPNSLWLPLPKVLQQVCSGWTPLGLGGSSRARSRNGDPAHNLANSMSPGPTLLGSPRTLGRPFAAVCVSEHLECQQALYRDPPSGVFSPGSNSNRGSATSGRHALRSSKSTRSTYFRSHQVTSSSPSPGDVSLMSECPDIIGAQLSPLGSQLHQMTPSGGSTTVAFAHYLLFEEHVTPEQKDHAALYEKALVAYQETRFDESIEICTAILDAWPGDTATRKLLNKAGDAAAGIGVEMENWTGVTVFNKKK